MVVATLDHAHCLIVNLDYYTARGVRRTRDVENISTMQLLYFLQAKINAF